MFNSNLQFELVDFSTPEQPERQQLHMSLLSAFHALCALDFRGCELEDRSVWEHCAQRYDPERGYSLTFTIAYTTTAATPTAGDGTAAGDGAAASGATATATKTGQQQEQQQQQQQPQIQVLGGAAQEFYPAARCGFLAYVVTAAAARGQGLASQLVERGAAALNAQSLLLCGAQHPCRDVLIEVRQQSEAGPETDPDPYHRRSAAVTRCAIWSKLAFLPLAISMVHVATPIEAGLHQLAVYRPEVPGVSEAERRRAVPAAIIETLLHAELRGVAHSQGAEAVARFEQAFPAACAEWIGGRQEIEIDEGWR